MERADSSQCPRPSAGNLLDLLGQRRRECLSRGWPDVPDWVFPSRTRGPLHPDNFERSRLRLRRKARKEGVWPLKLHCTRHTWASMALAAGKSVRWVADQLGHSSPMLTLRTYAHALQEEEGDLSFTDFGTTGVSARLQASPTLETDGPNEEAPGLSDQGPSRNLEREIRTGDIHVGNVRAPSGDALIPATWRSPASTRPHRTAAHHRNPTSGVGHRSGTDQQERVTPTLSTLIRGAASEWHPPGWPDSPTPASSWCATSGSRPPASCSG
jgi:hypothetical protein